MGLTGSTVGGGPCVVSQYLGANTSCSYVYWKYQVYVDDIGSML